jgi:hypothetical protein
MLFLAACSSPADREAEERKAWEERFRREDAWESRLGGQVDAEGVTENLKAGTAVGGLWIDGGIPEGLEGKKVRVTGRLIRRNDLPVFRREAQRDFGMGPAGIPVPEGVDLERARRRYLIADPVWKKIED